MRNKLKVFQDLKFENKIKDEHTIKQYKETDLEYMLTGKQALMYFKNDYGVSVISGWGAYGSDQGLYELAVMKKDHGLAYHTPITSDVEGYLTEEDVTKYMRQVQKLTEFKIKWYHSNVRKFLIRYWNPLIDKINKEEK